MMFRSRPASLPGGPDTQKQPETESPRRVGFVFWLAWVVANVVGFGALATADWATGGTISRAGVSAWEFPGLLPIGLGGVIIGAAVGLMQALVLGWRGSRSALWVLATAAGMPAAFTIGVIAYVVGFSTFGALGFLKWWAWGALSLPMGAAIGISQIFVLRGRLPRPFLWVLANMVGYATGYVAGTRTGVAWGEHHGAYIGAIVGYTLGGGVVGVITGIALVWLLRLPHRPPLERPALSITRSMVDGLGLLRYWPVLSMSFLAWVIAEGVVLPLTQVEAPNAEASALMVSGLLLLLAMASFVVDTAAGLVAPASGVGRRRLPALMLALAPVMLVLGLPFYLLSLSMSCMLDPRSTDPVCWLIPLEPLILLALVYLALRLALAPAAVVLGGTGVHKAFMVSWQLTKEQWGRLLLLGSPAVVLWSGVALVSVPWPMSWLTIVHGVLGGVAFAWLAIVLTLAYIQLEGVVQSGQVRSARSIHKTVILGMVVFAVVGVGLDVGRHGIIPSRPGRIAFASARHGTAQIYVMNPDGSNVTRLTHPPGVAWSPRFSPDGRRIVFFAHSARNAKTQIAMMSSDGSGETHLTDLPGYYGEELGFTRAGSKIAFVSCDREISGSCETEGIYLMNTDGSNLTHLADLPPHGFFATIRSDGRKIAFTRFDHDMQISAMDMDGLNVVNLIERGFTKAFSPEGGKIVFESLKDNEIYVMNADGSNPSRLTNLPGNSPAFSPDGRKIVFISPADGPHQIYIMDADGSNVTRLTARWDNRDPTISP